MFSHPTPTRPQTGRQKQQDDNDHRTGNSPCPVGPPLVVVLPKHPQLRPLASPSHFFQFYTTPPPTTAMAHHAASTSRTIIRALEAMEGKPEQELAALHRLTTVFATHAAHTPAGSSGSSTATNGDLLNALAKAILDDGAEEYRAHTPELDVSHSSCISSLASAPFKCPTRRFGRTELQMPILTLGGMRMQQTWQPAEGFSMADVTAECQYNFEAIIARALELGINHIETAKGYGSRCVFLSVLMCDYLFTHSPSNRDHPLSLPPSLPSPASSNTAKPSKTSACPATPTSCKPKSDPWPTRPSSAVLLISPSLILGPT